MIKKKEVRKRFAFSNNSDKKRTLKSSFCQGVIPQLTQAERDVLYLFTKEFLTIKKIAIRRECSVRAVQKVVKKLKEKGALNIGSQEVRFLGLASELPQETKEEIRLHGERWRIRILDKSDKSRSMVGQTLRVDGNTIKMYRDVLIIYSTKSFFGVDTYAATAKSVDYWNLFFSRLEYDLKVILVKPRAQNIKRFRAEYALIENGLAKYCEDKGDKIEILTLDDGRVWFKIDNSFNLHEAETVHPETAEDDMGDVIKPFFDDLRIHKPPTMSQLMSLFYKSMEINKETAAGLNCVVTLLKSQLPEKEVIKPEPRGRADYIG